MQGQNGKRVVHACLVREGEKPGQQAEICQKVREYRAQPGEKGDAPQAHLFVREKKIEKGVTQAFVYLGRLAYVSDTGECPMSIVWELETPIPARWLDRFTR